MQEAFEQDRDLSRQRKSAEARDGRNPAPPARMLRDDAHLFIPARRTNSPFRDGGGESVQSGSGPSKHRAAARSGQKFRRG